MKKKIVIILIILIIVGSVGVGGYFIYQYKKQQDPFELEWILVYYDYMKKNNEELKKEQEILRYSRENEMIQFCKLENLEDPVMLYTYKELGQKFTKIFYIRNNTVNILKPDNKYATVEYLYDVEEKNYDYYVHETNSNEEKYLKISDLIKIEKQQDSEIQGYTVKEGEKFSVTTLEGQILELPKFDNKFVKTSVIDDRWTKFNLSAYEEEIKNEFSEAIKKMNKKLTNDEKQEVGKKELEINSRKKEMLNALQEIEKQKQAEEERKRAEEAAKKAEEEARKKAEEEAKKAEEEARKKAEEEAKKLLEEQKKREEANTGRYTLKYGTYKGTDYWNVNDPLSKYEITIILKEDGRYEQTNLVTVAGLTETYTGTFTLSNVDGIGTYITFSANDEAYQITGNNQFTSSTGAVIKYQGN